MHFGPLSVGDVDDNAFQVLRLNIKWFCLHGQHFHQLQVTAHPSNMGKSESLLFVAAKCIQTDVDMQYKPVQKVNGD